MDDDEDFDFDAIDRLEQNALAARQTTNKVQLNQQFAPPQQSYPAYQPPNNASTSGYHQPPHQQGWNGGGQAVPWQQPQQQWPPPVAAHGGGQPQPHPQQQSYHAYNSGPPPGQILYNAPGQQQQPQQQNYGWQQQSAALPPPHQPAYHNQQQQWNPPPPAPQGYGYPQPVPQPVPQQQQQGGNNWQPVQRPSVWQPNHLPLVAPQNNINNGYSNYQQQQQQHVQGNTISRGGQAAYSGASIMEQQKAHRQPQQQQQQQQGAKAGGGGGVPSTDRAQRDLFSLWGVQKQPQHQQQQQHQNTTVGYNSRAGQSNMAPPPVPPSASARQQIQHNTNNHGVAPPIAYTNNNKDNTTDSRRPQITSSTTPAAAIGLDNNMNNNKNRNTAAMTTTARDQLIECETTTGCLKVSPEAAQHWIYPLGVPERAYQLSAISTALLQNTLVCLPTGLGKTLIAAVVMQNFSRWFPESKVVFVAPTKPLVSQQIEACRRFMGLSEEASAELTGRIKAEERKALWQDSERRVFFCTPQTFFNDVKLGVCPYDAVSCVVVDECHRATGQSEIAQTLRLMRQKYKLKFRVLGLSATPGGTVDQVQEVLTNLGAAAVHFRNEEDPDVSPYVHKKLTELVIVEPESELNNPRTLLLAVLQRVVGHLAGARFYFGPVNAERVTRLTLVQAQNTAKEAAAAGSGGIPSVTAQEWFRQATVLTDVRDSLDKYGILPTAALVRTKLSEERCIKALHTKEPTFSHFVTKLEASAAAGGGGPRLAKLVGILRQHFEGDGTPGGVIVFASLRESVQAIVDALKQHAPLIRARSFVGQGGGSGAGGGRSISGGRSKSGGNGGGGGPGMNQKEQKDAIKGFSNGQYNVLVATCIGEEGLDIPAVDLILCYDATASPTRAVQRRGRTGRHREGKVIYLLGAGREEEHYHRIKEATTQLHSQLRQAERYFELVLPGPRMLPRQYNPEKIEVESGYSDIHSNALAIATDSAKVNAGAGGSRTGTRGRGRGAGAGRAGAGRGGNTSGVGSRGRDPALQPAGAPGVLAMLEAGAIRLAEEGPRYPQPPTSPSPSQPGATQFDSPAGPHQLLFPETSSLFIRPGSNGRRLAIAPPPPLEVLLSGLNNEQPAADGAVGAAATVAAENNDVTKVPTPQQPRRLRFLPELGDDGVITLPCGKILKQFEEGEQQQHQQQPSWAFLAAAIARPPQPQPDATAVAATGAGGSKKRKTAAGSRGGRGKKAAPPAAAVPRPTPPTAVLNLAHVAEDVAVQEDDVQQVQAPAGPPVPAETSTFEKNETIERAAVEAEAIVEEKKEPEVIDLVDSEDEQQPHNNGNNNADNGGATIDGDQDDHLLEEEGKEEEQQEEIDVDDEFDMIESSSQPGPINDFQAPVPASTAATAAKNSLPDQAEDDLDIPLAKRMRMLRGGGGGGGGTAAGAAAAAAACPPPLPAGCLTSDEEKSRSLESSEPCKPPLEAPPPPPPTSAPNYCSCGAAAVVDDLNNYADFNDGGDGCMYDDYGFNGGFEEDELWEEWQDEEAMAAAAEVEREREENERREQEEKDKQQQQGGPRRRNIITSQSPGSTQPLAIAPSVHHISSDHSSLPSAIYQQQQQLQLQEQRQGEEQNRGLTRLRKAGAHGGGRNGQRDLEGNTNNEREDGVGVVREHSRALHQQQRQQQQPWPHPRPRGGPSAAAARFLDTEAQLSGDDSDGGGNEGEDLDGYESDFIDDGTQGGTAGEDGGGGGGNGGGIAQDGGSLATPRDHASLAAFHFRRLHEERNSPSPGSLLRRLQRARLGRRGGAAAATPSNMGYAGLSAPYSSHDDYDREDSFIDDGEGDEDEEEEGFDTPAGRDSHADNCCQCGHDEGELLLCDACPAAFHIRCVGLAAVPIGDWFCPVCADSNTPGGGSGGAGRAKPMESKDKSFVVAGVKQKKPNQPLPNHRPPAVAPRPPPPQKPPQKPPAAEAAVAKGNNNKRPLLDSDSDDDFA